MKKLIELSLRRGWRQGVLEGNRSWLVIGGVALTVRVLQRLGGKEEKVVFREKLSPGETVVIAHERTVSS
jgi:hypothetical protein